MQLKKKARNLVLGGALAAGSFVGVGAAFVGHAGTASADSLPQLRDEFCVTQTINAGTPSIEGKTCTGQYTVDKSTYQFTQDQLNACPKDGTVMYATYKWISPPTGGDPTIWAGASISAA